MNSVRHRTYGLGSRVVRWEPTQSASASALIGDAVSTLSRSLRLIGFSKCDRNFAGLILKQQRCKRAGRRRVVIDRQGLTRRYTRGCAREATGATSEALFRGAGRATFILPTFRLLSVLACAHKTFAVPRVPGNHCESQRSLNKVARMIPLAILRAAARPTHSIA